MKHRLNRFARHALVAVMGATAALSAAHAEGRRIAAVSPLPQYQQECAACHIAYPPGLLPAASWQRVMNNLSHHYGTDASVDAATLKELSAWLASHAGTGKRAGVAPPDDRITRSAWFVRQHDEVPAAAWKRESVKSASNCAACHAQADQGDFDEDRVRIPR
ncbi:MAG: cytochrome C [Burkholderiales bacterium 28-67-8]|nr:MAG: cytochrome C [Burkholderiales bacterium 28-67-8]